MPLLEKDFSLQELKNVFLGMNYSNIKTIRFITRTNFEDCSLSHTFVETDLWLGDINRYTKQKRLEKKISNIAKYYFKLNNSPFIEMKSKSDVIKLDKIKVSLAYLMSLNLILFVREYLRVP